MNLAKRIWASAPVWAWVVMIVCALILVTGLVISSNRGVTTTATAPDTSAATPSSAEPAATPATVEFTENAKANPGSPKTLVLLGDSTGASTSGWAPQLGTALGNDLDRPLATAYWDKAKKAYGAPVKLGTGSQNGPVGFWNGSVDDRDAAYARANLDGLIGADVTPDLILLNFGHTEDPSKPLASQVQPLIDELKQKYPNAALAVVKQNPTKDYDAAFNEQLAGYASAMDVEGIQVVDVYSAFPNDAESLAFVMATDTEPNAEGQKLWLNTMLTAFGLPAEA